MIESQVAYVLDALGTLEQRGAREFEIRADVEKRYDDALQESMQGTVRKRGQRTQLRQHEGVCGSAALLPPQYASADGRFGHRPLVRALQTDSSAEVRREAALALGRCQPMTSETLDAFRRRSATEASSSGARLCSASRATAIAPPPSGCSR